MIDGDGFAHATYHWENVTRCAQPYGHLSETAQLAMPPNWGAAAHEYAVEFTVWQCQCLIEIGYGFLLLVFRLPPRPFFCLQPEYLAYVYDGVTVLNLTSVAGNPNKPVLWDVPYYLILNTVSAFRFAAQISR